MIRKAFAAASLVAILSGVSGCSPIVPATPHPAVSATNVILYDKVPSQYEVHGVVMSDEVNKGTSEWKAEDGWKADNFVDQMKAAAGAKKLFQN